jgi:7-carboxy-7-deazaguanine synthase
MISEVFGPTVQGEGALIGVPTVFVRTGGCDYRCLAPETLITLHDLTQKPIELLKSGDIVLGYARINTTVTNGPLRLVPTPVVAVRSMGLEPTLRLMLDDGTELVCSRDHRWWVERIRNGWVWKSPRRRGLEGNYREAQNIRLGDFIKGMGRAICQPDETDTWKRGYLLRCAHKRAAAACRGINQQRHRVVSIETGPTIPLYDIQTGTGNFLANGMVSHNCSWCDTLYAVLPEYKSDWHPMTTEEVFAEIQRLSNHQPLLITLSGGNPAIQPLGDLLDLGHAHGYTFAIETQGSIAQPWFARLDYLTLSPKPPSSQQVTRWERLDRCIAYARAEHIEQNTSPHQVPQISLKVVVFDEADFLYARQVAERYPDIPLYLQVGNHTPPHLSQAPDMAGILQRMDWLIQRVMAEKWYNVRVLPQLHVLLWGNKRGV